MSLLRETPLSLDEAVRAVSGRDRGAVVTFSGCVRDTEAGASIAAIDYEAYSQMAEEELGRILAEASARWGARVSLQHRVGRVPAGQASLVVACAAPHRREAFEACRAVVEGVKASAPIWKVSFEAAAA